MAKIKIVYNILEVGKLGFFVWIWLMEPKSWTNVICHKSYILKKTRACHEICSKIQNHIVFILLKSKIGILDGIVAILG